MSFPNLPQSQILPPAILVQTWCLLSRDENEEVSKHSLEMLKATFGDMKAVIDFVKENKIRV